MSKSLKWIFLTVCIVVALNTISSCGNNELAPGNQPPAPLKEPGKEDPKTPAPTPKPTVEPKPSPTPAVSPTPSPTPTPTPVVEISQPFLFATLGATSNRRAKLKNAEPLIPINRLIITNHGDEVTLRRISVSIPDASIAFDEAIALPTDSETEVILGIETVVKSVRFYVDGETSGLEVRAADSRH